jgi:WD40 repeat protein
VATQEVNFILCDTIIYYLYSKHVENMILDILDLSWSAKDQYLASCSIDNTVIIWNALKFPGKL